MAGAAARHATAARISSFAITARTYTTTSTGRSVAIPFDEKLSNYCPFGSSTDWNHCPFYTDQNTIFLNWAGMRPGLGWVGLASHRRHSQGFSLACLLLSVKIYYRCANYRLRSIDSCCGRGVWVHTPSTDTRNLARRP